MVSLKALLSKRYSGNGMHYFSAFPLVALLSVIIFRASVTSAEAGQCVSLALKRVRRAAIRKGMVIVHKTEGPPPRGESFSRGVYLCVNADLRTQLNGSYKAVRGPSPYTLVSLHPCGDATRVSLRSSFNFDS